MACIQKKYLTGILTKYYTGIQTKYFTGKQTKYLKEMQTKDFNQGILIGNITTHFCTQYKVQEIFVLCALWKTFNNNHFAEYYGPVWSSFLEVIVLSKK